jgi:hypothetical protein
MSVSQNVEASFRKILNDTLLYYASIPGDHSREIGAIQRTLSLKIGNPEAQDGVDLASLYYKAMKEGLIQKPKLSRKSMSSSQRAVSDALDLLELVQSKSHPQRGRIRQLRAALNTPLPRSSTDITLSQRRTRLRMSQKRSNALKSNKGPVPYNIRDFNARRRTNGRKTFAPRIGSPLAADAQAKKAQESAY